MGKDLDNVKDRIKNVAKTLTWSVTIFSRPPNLNRLLIKKRQSKLIIINKKWKLEYVLENVRKYHLMYYLYNGKVKDPDSWKTLQLLSYLSMMIHNILNGYEDEEGV